MIRINLPYESCRPIDTNIDVKLLDYKPLWLIANGIRYSHNNHRLSDSYMINVLHNQKNQLTCGECGGTNIYRNENDEIECNDCFTRVPIYHHLGYKDKELIKRVGFKYKHESVLEHSTLSFHIGMSRATLQEFSRHRLISPTVKSTRYTLKELKDEKPFYLESDFRCQETEIGKRASKYLIYTGNDRTDHNSILALENVRQSISVGVSNDIAKFSIPESFRTELQFTVNFREFLHILHLRLSPEALWEFRIVSYLMIKSLPTLFKEIIFTDDKIVNHYKKVEEDLLETDLSILNNIGSGVAPDFEDKGDING